MLPTPRSVAICLVLFCNISPGLRAQAPPSPSPPPPICWLTQGGWVWIGGASYWFGTGTPVNVVQDFGNTLRVKNGNYEFDINRQLVTTDVNVAQLAWEQARQQYAEAVRAKAEAKEREAALQLQEQQRQAALQWQTAQWQAAQWQAAQWQAAQWRAEQWRAEQQRQAEIAQAQFAVQARQRQQARADILQREAEAERKRQPFDQPEINRPEINQPHH